MRTEVLFSAWQVSFVTAFAPRIKRAHSGVAAAPVCHFGVLSQSWVEGERVSRLPSVMTLRAKNCPWCAPLQAGLFSWRRCAQNPGPSDYLWARRDAWLSAMQRGNLCRHMILDLGFIISLILQVPTLLQYYICDASCGFCSKRNY